jgi:hypothetical protein
MILLFLSRIKKYDQTTKLPKYLLKSKPCLPSHLYSVIVLSKKNILMNLFFFYHVKKITHVEQNKKIYINKMRNTYSSEYFLKNKKMSTQ